VFIKIDFGESKILLMMRTTSSIIILCYIIMPYFPKKKGNKKPAMARTRGYKKRVGKSDGFAKRVKAVLMKTAETKSLQFFQDNIPLSDYKTGAYLGTTNTMYMIPLTPDSILTPISLGTAQSQRIGNKVQISKITLRGMLNPRTYQTSNTTESPTNNEPMPVLVKMWIGYQKDTAFCEVDQALPNFFQEGATSASPSGTLMDTFRKVNTDKYVIVATRQFKVGPQFIVTTQQAPGAANNQDYGNNDFKFLHKFSFDVTKHCVKVLKYNDGNNQPNTRGLFWWVEAIDITGANITTGRFPAELSYELDIQYKDI